MTNEIPTSSRLLLWIMIVVLFALLLFAKGSTDAPQSEENWMWCTNAYDVQLKLIRDEVETYAEAASLMREMWCDAEANQLELNWGKTEAIDDNLTDRKQEDWRRLNSNGYSQRHLDLEWTDRQERIISLLNQYGFDWEDTWYTIRTIARIYRVYPETIVCIAYADSSLWKYLKTDYNYGNVGNNDRGDTVSYNNIEQGFNAIAKTLNNQYLGWYTTINQLSRYGNAEGKVYATSPENWHINVTNCLGMIHNKRIADDWNFRF